jgi:mannitol/fructose-specific phosphotransferase system IIA component (Ntr-type)
MLRRLNFTPLFPPSQNPELMAEAQKMMDNPEFQKQMKKLQQSKDFKESIKKTTEKLKDPNQAAAAEAKLEHMVKVGNHELKKGARSAVEEAMASMANPEVMAEMAKMIKDPSFVRQLESMSKDPTFKNYIDAVRSDGGK